MLDVYSDALLAAHEAEIARLEALKEQRAPTLAMIDKYRSLVKDRDDLAASSQDASRLMAKKGEKRDPTRLLREEKMRKRITKELPKVEAELRQELEKWEDEYGRPFLVHGERYLDELEMTSQTKALPPRSKTPSVPPSTATLKKQASTTVTSKANSVRGGLPPRSKTPSAIGHHTLQRNIAPPSISTVTHSTNTVKSPSRIPARVPLSNLQHGNNSPPKLADCTSTLRGKVMAPPRLPPPKMKDLFSQSTIGERTTPLPNTVLSENMPSSSIVRHVAPEDVYDDREDRTLTASQFHHHHSHSASASSFSQSTYYPNAHPQHHSHHQSISSLSNSSFPSRPPSTNPTTFNTSITTSSYPRSNPYGPAPPTRQTSNTSTASSTISSNPGSQISGSENWETYSSASSAGEPETDVRDTAAYYARLRAQQGNFAVPQQQHHGKRMAADGGWNSPGHLAAPAGKRVKGLMGPSSQSRYVSAEGGQVEGSEAGWTDEDGF
jgi:protein regulator of cytokinesis 1